MDITWYGLSCFRLRDKNITIVTDPYDKSAGLRLPRLKADVVTLSCRNNDCDYVAAVGGEPFLVDGPGEYEFKSTFVTGIALPGNGTQERNTVYVYEFAETRVCHLGHLKKVPSQAQVEEIGDVDLVLIPVGGKDTIDARQAAEVISLIEPAIVVPMYYQLPGLSLDLDSVDRFLQEMGAKGVEPEESLRVTSRNMPEDTQVVILESKAK